MTRRLSRKCRGTTAVEIVVASMVFVLILTVGINTMITGLKTMDQGLQSAQMEQKAQYGMRRMVSRLREAAAVSVDSNGLGITFYLPVTSGDGSYASPVAPSTTPIRFYYSGGSVWEKIGTGAGVERVQNVLTSDPNSTGDFKMFRVSTSNGNTLVTVCFAAKKYTENSYALSRLRETILLRNVPAVTK